MEGYFLNVNNIQDRIGCHTHSMTMLLFYFFENPTGNYHDFFENWKNFYKNGYSHHIDVKSEISKLRKFNILTVNKDDIYNFNPNGDEQIISELAHLTSLKQYEKANEIIKEKYQIKSPIGEDFAGWYRVYNKETKELLYIGSSIHLYQRKIQHYRYALWPLDVKNYYSKKYTVFRELIKKDLLEWEMIGALNQDDIDIQYLRNHEKMLIKKEKPLLNIQWNN